MFFLKFCLFTIYEGKPLAWRCGQIVSKFRTGKFRCTNCAKEKSRESLKLVSMINFKNWNKNFPLYIPSGENRNTFSEALLLREIFHWNNPKTLSCFIYFLKGFFRNALQMANQPWLRLGKGSYFKSLYYYMRNFCSLIGLEQWYFSSIWNTYMWK